MARAALARPSFRAQASPVRGPIGQSSLLERPRNSSAKLKSALWQPTFSCYEEGVLNLWKRKPALGIGIGVSLIGAVALAARYGLRRAPREIPDDISPAIFATRVTETIFGR